MHRCSRVFSVVFVLSNLGCGALIDAVSDEDEYRDSGPWPTPCPVDDVEIPWDSEASYAGFEDNRGFLVPLALGVTTPGGGSPEGVSVTIETARSIWAFSPDEVGLTNSTLEPVVGCVDPDPPIEINGAELGLDLVALTQSRISYAWHGTTDEYGHANVVLFVDVGLPAGESLELWFANGGPWEGLLIHFLAPD